MNAVESISQQASPLVSMITKTTLEHVPLATVSLAVATINIVLYFLILKWGNTIKNDPKCACAKNWKLNYIMFFPPLAILAAVAVITWFATSDSSSIIGPSSVMTVLAIGWIIMIVAGYRYLNDLTVSNCTCATSDMIGDEALQIYTAIKVAWLVMLVIIALSGAYVLRTL